MRRLSIVVGCVFVLFGCGGGGGASPEVYDVAIDYFRVPDSCYRPNNAPTVTVITEAPLSKGRWLVWDGPDGRAYLEVEAGGGTIRMGDAPSVTLGGTLEGTRVSAGWQFSVTQTVINKPPLQAFTETSRAKATGTFERSAGPIKGSLRLESLRTCDGTCQNNFQTDNPPCTIDPVNFRGTRVAVSYQRPP